MPIFERNDKTGSWIPSEYARGPFAGLQGGAVASLLAADIEAIAADKNLGTLVHAATWFLRPAPLGPLRTQPRIIHSGGRVSVVDNMLFAGDDDALYATARFTLMRERAVEVAIASTDAIAVNPEAFPVRNVRAPHGGRWFMDSMEARQGDDGSVWFRPSMSVIDGAGPMSMVLGPADWAHGIGRPVSNVVADPNPDLSVHLLRPPCNSWIGVGAVAHWRPAAGNGIGRGVLCDIDGEIGCVSMSVALTPFPATSLSK